MRLVRLIDAKRRREATLGSADDALDPDGERILDELWPEVGDGVTG
jgi:hypothetical protein